MRKKWPSRIFQKKSHFPEIWESGPKNRPFGIFLKIDMMDFLDILDMIRGQYWVHFAENCMSGENGVLELWPKTVSSNQIARFFKFEYLKNGLTV